MKLMTKWIKTWIDGVMMDGLIPMLIPMFHPLNDGWIGLELSVRNVTEVKTTFFI